MPREVERLLVGGPTRAERGGAACIRGFRRGGASDYAAAFRRGGFQITGASRFRTPGQFAGDVTRLADERRDLELRELVNELHFDLLILRGDDDDG
jgi:hypothetical protein